ncbi:MAG: folate family ECF transporter S component [Lachnospiraceae bacterium]|nr:folate family ECF transporter S component [Lachnospiraceae bacterium]
MAKIDREEKRRLFQTPFCRDYWKLAAREFTDWRVLVLAAMLTAMRIAIKSLSIYVGPDLKITFGFIVNAVASMIYGPLVAIVTSAISDTLGAILFPSGTYFFPFIFEEIAGGVIFALFYYRAKLSTTRVMLGRLAVTVICNLLLNPTIMIWYYKIVLGKSYRFLTWPRLAKNIALFPIQTVILVLLFNMLLPVTNRMELTYTGSTKLEITKKNVITLILLTVLSAAVVAAYYLWVYVPKG